MTLSHKLNVKWIVKEDDNTLSELAAQVLIDVLMNTARPVIGFATGGTPRKLYQHLVRKSQADQQLQRHWQDMIGFNEPSDRLEIETHVTHLSEGTRQANALYFQDGTVPLQAITMGMGSILHAKKIILLAFGSVKRQALLRAFSGTIDTRCPASFLQLHNNIIIFTDQIL